jgi:hypothetical protein
MVVLNIVIIAFILRAAVVVPFLPEGLQDSAVATAIRTALIALLLLIPGLIVIRETQRAGVRGAPRSSCRNASTPSCTARRRISRSSWGCGGGRTSSWPTATGR